MKGTYTMKDVCMEDTNGSRDPLVSSITHADMVDRQTKTIDRSRKATAYCFTAFNEEHLTPLLEMEGVKVLVVAKEYAPTTGKLHYQGYVRFSSQQRVGGLMTRVPKVHWEMRRGTEGQAVAYIKDVASYNAQHPMERPKEQGEVIIDRGVAEVTVRAVDDDAHGRAAALIARGAPPWQVCKELGPRYYYLNSRKIKDMYEDVRGWCETGVEFE